MFIRIYYHDQKMSEQYENNHSRTYITTFYVLNAGYLVDDEYNTLECS